MKEADQLTDEDVSKIRSEILQWEDEFTARNGRKPTKEDLQDIDEGDDGRRSSRIYDYYMLYSKWKKLRADRQRQGQEPAAPRSGAPQRKLSIKERWAQTRGTGLDNKPRAAGAAGGGRIMSSPDKAADRRPFSTTQPRKGPPSAPASRQERPSSSIASGAGHKRPRGLVNHFAGQAGPAPVKPPIRTSHPCPAPPARPPAPAPREAVATPRLSTSTARPPAPFARQAPAPAPLRPPSVAPALPFRSIRPTTTGVISANTSFSSSSSSSYSSSSSTPAAASAPRRPPASPPRSSSLPPSDAPIMPPPPASPPGAAGPCPLHQPSAARADVAPSAARATGGRGGVLGRAAEWRERVGGVLDKIAAEQEGVEQAADEPARPTAPAERMVARKDADKKREASETTAPELDSAAGGRRRAVEGQQAGGGGEAKRRRASGKQDEEEDGDEEEEAPATKKKKVGKEAAVAKGKRGPAKALKPGEISDNFVALNLKRKGTTRYRKVKSSKQVARRRAWQEDRQKRIEQQSQQGQGQGSRRAVRPARSIDLIDACLDLNAQAAAAASSGSSTDRAVAEALRDVRANRARGIREVKDKSFKALAPRCAHHQHPARLLRVKKAGPNKGRRFYVCSFPKGEGCDFFMWVEDNPMLVAAELAEGAEPEEEFQARQSQCWRDRYSAMTVPELKALAKSRGLAVAGKKADLVGRLVDHASSLPPGAMAETSSSSKKAPGGGRQRKGAAKAAEPASSSDEEELEDDDDDMSVASSSSSQRGGRQRSRASRTSATSAAPERGPAKDRPVYMPAPQTTRDDEGMDIDDDDEEEVVEEEEEGGEQEGGGEELIVLDDDSECGSSSSSDDSDDEDEEDEVEEEEPSSTKSTAPAPPRPPTLPVVQDGEPITDERLEDVVRQVFGYDGFRPGQLWAIRRALLPAASLLVAPTGGGKSLCYQTVAAINPPGQLVVVISPLISLMQDQMSRLPPQVLGACLAGNLSMRETARILRDLSSGRLRVLFLSPEKLCSPSFQRLVASGPFPPVSLVCIDEAHCMSQWSHNFRPAFLRLGANIQQVLRPRSVLAMTATADPDVVRDICSSLHVDHETGVLCQPWRRPNLRLRVELVGGEGFKRQRLLEVLNSPPFDRGSVIVYVRQQRDADRIREYLISENVEAVAYHAGMDLKHRDMAQAKWMRGSVRVCVATVAFGLGVDKSDVRGVVHYEMAKSVESLVQESGRAGRDGREAWGLTLLVKEDFQRQHSLSHSDGVTALQIRALLATLAGLCRDSVPPPAASKLGEGEEDEQPSPKPSAVQVALDIKATSSSLDMREEVVETLLVLLEVDLRVLRLLGSLADDCLVVFRKREASALRKTEAIIDTVMAVGQPSADLHARSEEQGSFGTTYGYGSVRFSLVKLTAALGEGWKPHEALRELQRLQSAGEIQFSASPSRHYHLSTSHRLLLPEGREAEQQQEDGSGREPFGGDVNELVAWLARKVEEIETTSVSKVEKAYGILRATASIEDEQAQEQKAVELIDKYFDKQEDDEEEQEGAEGSQASSVPPAYQPISEGTLASLKRDFRALMLDPRVIQLLHDVLSRARAGSTGLAGKPWEPELRYYRARLAARVFHGLGSPRMPTPEWRESPFWSRYAEWSFESVVQALMAAS